MILNMLGPRPLDAGGSERAINSRRGTVKDPGSAVTSLLSQHAAEVQYRKFGRLCKFKEFISSCISANLGHAFFASGSSSSHHRLVRHSH